MLVWQRVIKFIFFLWAKNQFSTEPLIGPQDIKQDQKAWETVVMGEWSHSPSPWIKYMQCTVIYSMYLSLSIYIYMDIAKFHMNPNKLVISYLDVLWMWKVDTGERFKTCLVVYWGEGEVKNFADRQWKRWRRENPVPSFSFGYAASALWRAWIHNSFLLANLLCKEIWGCNWVTLRFCSLCRWCWQTLLLPSGASWLTVALWKKRPS